MSKTIKLLPFQHDLIASESKYAALRGGLGAGKTFALCLWVIFRIVTYKGCRGVLCANSYSQLQRATLTTLFSICDDIGIGYRYNKLEQMVYFENGSSVKAQSLEAFDDLRGAEYAFGAVDEAAYTTQEAWNVLLGRIRLKGYGPLQVKAATTPNGFNFFYEIFKGNPSEYHEEIYADPLLNHHLPEGYLDSLKNSYDPLTYEQEVLGRYVANTTGKKYYAFDRNNHVREFSADGFVQSGLGASAGVDFNVSPITSCIGWLVNGTYYIYDEVFKHKSNTFELTEQLKLKNLKVEICYPDASGNQRRTSAARTDHQILRDSGFIVRHKRRNPPIKDRVNTVNWLFSQKRIVIHPRCENLIRDLEFETWEKNEPDVGHINDALGYWCWYETPMMSKTEVRQRDF